MKQEEEYAGFEVGPIRPPSEANSLLLRLTRNCPWNKCKFCGLYKGEKFSIRPVDHVLRDIDVIKKYVDELTGTFDRKGATRHEVWRRFQASPREDERMAFHFALSWLRSGITSNFLQDANSLVMKPDDLVAILQHILKTFPHVKRTTSYARSNSIARIADDDLGRISEAGLNRIHIGMESGCDAILDSVRKGAKKVTHIVAGQKVKGAGIELSEYFMPGLGGEKYSQENALETADAMNQINPDFIRIRTLAIPDSIELFRDCRSGAFAKLGDVQTAEEILLFLENLNGITSTVKSDHIVNLFHEAEGRLPDHKARMMAPIRKFLGMEPREQTTYMIGRRTGIFTRLDDMKDPDLLQQAERVRDAHRITIDNVEAFTAKIVKRFI